MEKIQVTFRKLEPAADPEHGKPCTRSSHGLSIINNGSRLILFGGEHVARTPLENNQALWAADLNVSTQTWKWRCIKLENCPSKRIAHAQAVCNNMVYVFGGRAGVDMKEAAMNDLWKLDASGERGSEVWTKVETSGPVPEVRSFHKMIAIGEKLFVFGGCGAEGRLADLHSFDVATSTWTALETSLLRGRGGPNLMPFDSGALIGVVAGFAGEETSDGNIFDLAKNAWEEKLMQEKLEGLRPRSVCCSASFPSIGVSVVFGGEVDPSDRGHEGADGFENDIVCLDEKTGAYLGSKPASGPEWPETRGWSDAASIDDGGKGVMCVFGGLSGDDANPKRLDDLWCLQIQ